MFVYSVVEFTTVLILGGGDWPANVARCDVTELELTAVSEELPHISQFPHKITICA